MAKTESLVSGYRIGTVSRLTGISPDTLRIWERRYEVVTPERSQGGGRLYSSDDIARLKLIRRLVDKGDTISVVAHLSHDELQERLAASSIAPAEGAAKSPARLVVVGELLSAKMKAAAESLRAVDLVACYESTAVFAAATDLERVDVLVIEQPSLQPETALQVVEWMERVNAAHAVIIYRFARQETLEQLPRSKCTTLRAPVDAETVQNYCVAMLGRYISADTDEGEAAFVPGELAPPRRYSDEMLARLAGISSTIKCECPRHLAELIASLSAFEKYSSECESRNLKDAELHNYLNTTASQARHMFETALSLVIEAENIEL